ncbi:DedA family protein [Mycetocola saprophilus]|uniref:DedA family protein n=1 Tax=Mycetocola saprophilus TaxID=76636 RepID=UPI0009DDEDBB|nr:DedA family protein [Mycetocola saprophilus]
MEFLTDAILTMATSPWIYLIVLAMVLIDGFFPPVPGEAVLVGATAIAISAGSPNVWVLLVAGAIGAAIGDNIAFRIGRAVGVERYAWMRKPRVVAALDFARRGLEKRGTLLVLGGRYIPVGRIAINMTAGATGFPPRRFAALSVVAGFLWSIHAILIGALAGHLTQGNPLIGAVLGIGFAILLGIIIDTVGRIRRAIIKRSAARRGTTVPARPITASAIRDREIDALTYRDQAAEPTEPPTAEPAQTETTARPARPGRRDTGDFTPLRGTV